MTMKNYFKYALCLVTLLLTAHFNSASAANIGIRSAGIGTVINNGMAVDFSNLTFVSFNGATNLLTDTPSLTELGVNSFSGLSNINFSLTPNVLPIGSAISLSIKVDLYDPNNTSAPLATLTFDQNSNISGLNSIPLTSTFFNFNGFSAASFNPNLVLILRDVNIRINSTNDNPNGAPPSFIISTPASPTAAVPEPTTIALLSTGIAGVAAAVRKRRKSGMGRDE